MELNTIEVLQVFSPLAYPPHMIKMIHPKQNATRGQHYCMN